MPSATPSVKRQNHRVHQCDPERKQELLKHLLTSHADQDILIVTANNPEAIQTMVNNENIVITSDAALADTPELQCDLLISFDLPDTAADYMARLSHAKTHALILLDPQEQKSLYPIESLLGRTLIQEIISGFEPASVLEAEQKQKALQEKKAKREHKPRDEYDNSDRKRNDNRARDDKRPPRKPHSPNSKDEKKSDKWPNKKRESSRYLGKDENGKPIFSGKTGERNHKYDGSQKNDSDKNSKECYEGKPKFSGNDKKRSDEKPRAYDAKKRDDSQGKKPFNDSKPKGDREQRKPYEGSSKKYASQDDVKKSAPKRTPKKFGLKSLKPGKESK